MINKSYSVSKYLEAVRRLITAKIPTIWVRGTLTQVNVKGSFCYLSIAEIQEGETKAEAVLNLIVYRNDFKLITQKLKQVDVDLTADINVCFLLEADMYVPMGKFQGKVKDVDPSYTIGEIILAKDKIFKQLTKEGLVNKNKSLEFPLIPLKIGLISSEDSAAANDFMDSLNSSGFAFEVIPYWARMQGRDTEKTVIAGIDYFNNNLVDVVCLIRGGGSKSDLAWFDSEMICRAIAESKMPVLTGIGHEIDESLADLMAYQNLITPTACARYLVDLISEQWNYLQEYTVELNHKVKTRWNVEDSKLFNLGSNILHRFPLRIAQEKKHIKTLSNGLSKGPLKILAIHQAKFLQKFSRLEMLIRPRLALEGEKIKQLSKQLRSTSESSLIKEKETLLLKSRLLDSVKPEKALRRGYSIVRSSKGKIVSSSNDIKSGDSLEIQLIDSLVKTTVD